MMFISLLSPTLQSIPPPRRKQPSVLSVPSPGKLARSGFFLDGQVLLSNRIVVMLRCRDLIPVIVLLYRLIKVETYFLQHIYYHSKANFWISKLGYRLLLMHLLCSTNALVEPTTSGSTKIY